MEDNYKNCKQNGQLFTTLTHSDIKEKLELVLNKNRDSETIMNGNSFEKNGNSTIIQNQNGDSKKENNDSTQPKEDGKTKR